MTYTYRHADGRDGDACARIVQNWAAETPWLSPLRDFKRLVDWWSGCLHHVETSWVGEAGGQVIGFCVREEDNITGLYLAGEARGFGVGKDLFDLAKQYRDWITVWAYEKNTRARKFYRREGCIELSRDTEDETGLIDVEHRWTRPHKSLIKDQSHEC